jgi:predicted PurR-regulated permease PerM
MNKTNNRKIERIENLFNLLNISQSESEKLKNYTFALNDNLLEITDTLSDDFISGVIDGDGSFFISFFFILIFTFAFA